DSETAVMEIPSTAAPETDEKLEVAAVEIAALQTTEADSDGDSIPDRADLCGETRQGVTVDATGCADGVAINLQGVNFLYDSHELTPEAQRILDRVADILSQQPDLRLEVAGHTDAQGDPAYNQWLSLKRAEAVRDYMVAQGVNPNHIGAGGYGGQRPIADNTTKEGLRMNRRVELRRLQ
ncbi:OmpA family protein, partial [Pseudomonadota bacterium]